MNAPPNIEISSPLCQIQLHTINFGDIVVWNPWAETAKTISDLGPGEWKNFLCVEAGAPATLGFFLFIRRYHKTYNVRAWKFLEGHPKLFCIAVGTHY